MKFSPTQYRSMLILFILWSILLIWEALVIVILFPIFYIAFPAPFSFNFRLSNHIAANPQNDLTNHIDLSNRHRFIRSLCKNRNSLIFNGIGNITGPPNLDMRTEYNTENTARNGPPPIVITPNMLNGVNNAAPPQNLPNFIGTDPNVNPPSYFIRPFSIWDNNATVANQCSINGEYGNQPLTRASVGEALPYPITALVPIMILHMCIFFFILRLDILEELNTQQRAQISLWSNLVVSIILIFFLAGYCFMMDPADYWGTGSPRFLRIFLMLFVLGDFILSFTSMHYMYTILTV